MLCYPCYQSFLLFRSVGKNATVLLPLLSASGNGPKEEHAVKLLSVSVSSRQATVQSSVLSCHMDDSRPWLVLVAVCVLAR